jgi:hypothetical protein
MTMQRKVMTQTDVIDIVISRFMMQTDRIHHSAALHMPDGSGLFHTTRRPYLIEYITQKTHLAARGLAHQAARHIFLVGVKNHLMPRELAASVLPA